MFGCGITVLQNTVSSGNIFVVLHHWILGNTIPYNSNGREGKL